MKQDVVKHAALRFPGFNEPWKLYKAEDLFRNVTDKNHADETVLTIIQGRGTMPREQAGRNIHYDDKSLSGYKRTERGDFIIHLRSFEGGLEMANETGIVSPAYTILRCNKPHSSLFYNAYFHTESDIQEYIMYLFERGRLDDTGGLTVKTIRDVVLVLRLALTYGYAEKAIPMLNWDLIEYPKDDKIHRVISLSRDDEQALIQCIYLHLTRKSAGTRTSLQNTML